MHANLQTNDNWTTPFSLPFLSISSRDICWNLATVKILIFSGAHHRSTTIHSIVCHRLKKRKRPRSPDFPCKNLANALRNYTIIQLYRSKTRFPPSRPLPRAKNAHFAIVEYRTRTRLYPSCLSNAESFGNLFGPRKPDRNNRQIRYSVYYEFYDYV